MMREPLLLPPAVAPPRGKTLPLVDRGPVVERADLGERPLAAASGLLEVGHHRLVIADDALTLEVIPLAGGAPRSIPLVDDAELPSDPKARKAQKPDFESIAHLPRGFAGAAGGVALFVGSGSSPRRKRAAWIPLGEDGAPSGRPRLIDLGPLYASLSRQIPALNIEGAAVLDGRLRLLQRGNAEGGENVVIDLDLPEVMRALEEGRPLDGTMLLLLRRVDLGALAGRAGDVPLTFTDLSSLGDGRAVFTATAEDTDNPYDDGEVLGSAAGVLEADGTISSIHLLDARVKVEGVHARLVGERAELRLVTDADAPETPARLLEGSLFVGSPKATPPRKAGYGAAGR